MLRIIALNEEGNDKDEKQEDELIVAKEAQETIAESEYVRAIKLMSQGQTESTLLLLQELLQTKVINEITGDKNNEKLWTLRYNCYKNIAIINEKNDEYKVALENYILAMQIDNSDVYTMHRFGQLALKMNYFELAQHAFENCLAKNSSHWSAADGLLQTFERNNNILGAYGWALKLYRCDPHNQRAIKILREISHLFKEQIPFYEKFWGSAEIPSLGNELLILPQKEQLDCKNDDEKQKTENENIPSGLNEFCLKDLCWLSVGNYIIEVYNYLKKTEQSMLFILKWENIVFDENSCIHDPKHLHEKKLSVDETSDNSNSNSSPSATKNDSEDTKCEQEANSESSDVIAIVTPAIEQVPQKNHVQMMVIDISNEDSDPNPKYDVNDISKPKPRRRCSDLHFLEQWGWHKNRRYSSRKKTAQENFETDTTLNGFLRKTFAKFTNTSFAEGWPFHTSYGSTNTTDTTSHETGDHDQCQECRNPISNENFQKGTGCMFDAFVQKLKTKQFDLMVLIYKWLKYIAKCWDKRLPIALRSLYLDIYELYTRHFDLTTWNQMSKTNIIASYRICLLFLELDYTRTSEENGNLSQLWKSTLDHLTFHSVCILVALDEECASHKLRLVNLECLWHSFCDKLEKCVDCLEHMKQSIKTLPNKFVLHLPNLEFNCISMQFVCDTLNETERKVNLNNVSKMHESQQWSKLTNIITNNLENIKEKRECENWSKDYKIQTEILLESFWNLNNFKSCLIWSEKCLHYATWRYLNEAKNSYRQKLWSESINFIISFIEALILNESTEFLLHLDGMLSRMVQNLIRILSYLLDAPFEKNSNILPELEMKRPWVILHSIIIREENNSSALTKTKTDEIEDDDPIPDSFLVLFTAHEFLGKQQWCTKDNGRLLHYILDAITPNLKAPIYDACRDTVKEYIEQVTYCLYGYPQKKARSRHLEDHEATAVELTWPKAIEIFNLYKPECLPEFNSYKLESISADMEQLLLKIATLVPKELDPTPGTVQISEYITGTSTASPEPDDQASNIAMPYKISSLYYLLADYYFKNRDFSKTIKYYTLDLVLNADRFDSWAGMALSKASKIETKINSLISIDLPALLIECEDTIRCFERCISLDRNQTLLWIEYGSFSYIIHSYCSRHLKQSTETLPIDQLIKERRDVMLNIAYNCFSLATTLQAKSFEHSDENSESHEERWLCQYMLGKIAEKRKEQPNVYLNYYLTAANYLYESKATYPIKINHSNPTSLSVEALEVFYRTNAAILKYLKHEKEINMENITLFKNVLKNLSNSPFAFNKAKIDGNSLNALKRKLIDKNEKPTIIKTPKLLENALITIAVPVAQNPNENKSKNSGVDKPNFDENNSSYKTNKSEPDEKDANVQNLNSPNRRDSQESAATATTTTVTSSEASSTTTSDSSNTDTDTNSQSSTENEEKKTAKRLSNSAAEIQNLYKIVIRNIEECITRFPEHYKSIYRLVFHYLNGPQHLRNFNLCEQLLFGQYKTSLGNQINGLFYDKKNNNIFNGIWRIPSPEIDRPGSFSAYLVKCIRILIQTLKETNNHKVLIDIGMQLYRVPDNDKRYISEEERIKLYQRSLKFCVQIMREIFQKNMLNRNDAETLNLLIDLHKIHKKCVKYMNQKEASFTKLIVEVYKYFVKDKVESLPDNLNYLDLAIKLCLQEIAYRKNLEKMNSSGGTAKTLSLGDAILGYNNGPSTTSLSLPLNRPVQIPGLSLHTRMRPSSATITTEHDNTFLPTPLPSSNTVEDAIKSPNFMSMFGIASSQQNSIGLQSLDYKLVAEYYKTILENGQNGQCLNSSPAALQSPLSLASLPVETTITPAYGNLTNVQKKIAQKTTALHEDMHTAGTDLTITCKTTGQQEVFPCSSGSMTQTSSVTGNPMDTTMSQPQITPFQNLDIFNNCTNTHLPAKSKNLGKNKQATAVNRSMAPNNMLGAEMATLSMLNNLQMNNFDHTALLATYADLFKGSSLQQFHMLPKPQQRSPVFKRKLKQPVEIGHPSSSNVGTTTTEQPSQSISDSNATPKNSMSKEIDDASKNPNKSGSEPAHSTKLTTSSTILEPTLSQQHRNVMYPSQLSSKKTLQQKLAERQKAYQLNEPQDESVSSTATERKSIDVIILD